MGFDVAFGMSTGIIEVRVVCGSEKVGVDAPIVQNFSEADYGGVGAIDLFPNFWSNKSEKCPVTDYISQICKVRMLQVMHFRSKW